MRKKKERESNKKGMKERKKREEKKRKERERKNERRQEEVKAYSKEGRKEGYFILVSMVWYELERCLERRR